MRIQLLSSTLLAGFVGIAIASNASAMTNQRLLYSGSLCNPWQSTDAGKLIYDNYGVHNGSSSSANVVCGSGPLIDDSGCGSGTGNNIASIVAYVYDRSTTADVCCTVQIVNPDGTPAFSQNVCTSSSSSAIKTLSVSPSTPVDGSVVLQCSIPATQSGAPSYVTSYMVYYEFAC